MDEDYRVTPRSDEDCEAIASGWRDALVGAAPRFDIVAIIEKAGREFKVTKDLALVEKTEAEMGRREAYVQWVEGIPRIFAKKSVIDLARSNDPYGVSVLTHEFMHVVLEHRREDNDGAILPRLVTANKRPKYISPYESAEHQARVATAEFLMPRANVAKLKSVEEIIERFCTSRQASIIRYAEVVEQNKRRDPPESVKSYLSARKPPAPLTRSNRVSYTPVRVQSDADKAWESAALAPESDPKEYRLSPAQGKITNGRSHDRSPQQAK